MRIKQSWCGRNLQRVKTHLTAEFRMEHLVKTQVAIFVTVLCILYIYMCVYYCTTHFPTHHRPKIKLIVSNVLRKWENKLLGSKCEREENRKQYGKRISKYKTKFVPYQVKWKGSKTEEKRKQITRTNLLITFLFKILYSLLAIIKRWVSMSLKFIMSE